MPEAVHANRRRQSKVSAYNGGGPNAMWPAYYRYGEQSIIVAKPSHSFPGHEERMEAHTRRIWAELARLGEHGC